MGEIEESYFQAGVSGPIRLVIVGKDPYPGERTAIPFCKPDWISQGRHNCSGRYVLDSLGIDRFKASENFETPAELFLSLRNEGIVCLNASYEFLGTTLSRSHKTQLASAYHKINKAFLDKARDVILCGEACDMAPVLGAELIGPERAAAWTKAVHPDYRNSKSRWPNIRLAWREMWSPCAIVKRYGLSFRPDGSLTGVTVTALLEWPEGGL